MHQSFPPGERMVKRYPNIVNSKDITGSTTGLAMIAVSESPSDVSTTKDNRNCKNVNPPYPSAFADQFPFFHPIFPQKSQPMNQRKFMDWLSFFLLFKKFPTGDSSPPPAFSTETRRPSVSYSCGRCSVLGWTRCRDSGRSHRREAAPRPEYGYDHAAKYHPCGAAAFFLY